MTYVSEDIFMDILSKLPVKSLLRFRSVSKSWFSIISSPIFVKLQRERASSISEIGFQKVILPNEGNNIRSVDCESSNSFDDLSSCRLLKLPFFLGSGFIVLGSTNGLVCVCTRRYKMFHLWNPCTNEYKRLPPLEYSPNMEVAKYGFGYDSTTDDYKLLIATLPKNSTTTWYPNRIYSETTINIFSLKRGTWRSFVDTKHLSTCFYFSTGISGVHSRVSGIFSNNAIHWTDAMENVDRNRSSDDMENMDRNRSSANVIVSFGLAEETFNMLPFPDGSQVRMMGSCLSVLDGCLCLTTTNDPGLCCTHTIWMRKEFGLSSSWTKYITIGDFDPIYYYIFFRCYPLCLTKRGDIILSSSTDLAFFDVETKSLKALASTSYTDMSYSNLIVHVETLVSPNSSTETTKKRKRKRIGHG